jgi:hypothetical protein
VLSGLVTCSDAVIVGGRWMTVSAERWGHENSLGITEEPKQ